MKWVSSIIRTCQSAIKTCDFCGHHILPAQRYYDAGSKHAHMSCVRKAAADHERRK